MRMFGPAGNPLAEHPIAVMAALSDECGLSLTVHAMPSRRRTATVRPAVFLWLVDGHTA
jgi:hypothetical protein